MHDTSFMKQKIKPLIIMILLATTVYGQTYEPLELAKKIFGKDSLVNIENYVTGEYKGRPNGQDLKMNTITKFNLLEQTKNKSVVAMTVLDLKGKGLDTYLHFVKDTIWKMNAFRALAMTGTLKQVKTRLEKMTSQEVDEIIKQSKQNDDGGYTLFNSREAYNFKLGNTGLILEFDKNIIKHFLENQKEFERIKNLAISEFEKENLDEKRRIKLVEDFKMDYRKLFITNVTVGGYEFENCINFLIGGMIDNSVGYIYVKDNKYVPKMNPKSIIMIKKIADGWYIYKRT